VVNEPVFSLPEVAFDPVQLPDAEQEVALVELQVSVLLPPLLTDIGDADSETVGAGVEPPPTVTVVLACAVRPLPLVHVIVNVEVAVSAPVLWLPDSALLPLHAPEAVHDAVRELLQVNVLLLPELTLLGLAEIVTDGRNCAAAGVERMTASASSAYRNEDFMGGDHMRALWKTVCLHSAT
jgi:hypothetical protein